MIRLWFAMCLLCAAALAQRPEWIHIPPGSFNDTRVERPFWMSKTEVTVSQFGAFIKATGYRTAAERISAPRTWKTPGFKVSGNQPVVYVTVRDAAAYCEWIGARLPTDAEWEYAARAGATTWHYWGEAMDDRYLWYRVNSDDRPHDVGRKRPNAWGLYDVEGNVWEWAISEPIDGEPWGNRRGGSWIACPPSIGLSKYFKVPVKLDHRYDDIGFRCARSER
jgi:formylglycine-generating enzyme required for sulfatase activity